MATYWTMTTPMTWGTSSMTLSANSTRIEVTTFGSDHTEYWPAKMPSEPPLRGERKLMKLYGIDTTTNKEEAAAQLALYADIPEVELTDHERELLAIYDAIASADGKVIDINRVFEDGDRRDRLRILPPIAVAPVGAIEITLVRTASRDAAFVGDQRTKRRRRVLHDTFSAPGWKFSAPPLYFNVARDDYATGMATAKVPSILPTVRDKVEDGDLILWEPTWTKTRLEIRHRPDPDPAILRHATGSLYKVIAAWDLTKIEMKVLGQS